MIPLAQGDFESLRDYLRGTAGLEFDDSRRTSLAVVLTERLRVSGRTSVADYVHFIDRPEGAVERQHLLDAVTIQETHFHRARPQIDALREHILPSLLSAAASAGRGVTVWSAGCATGEEPYTLAMLALEAREGLGLTSTVPIRVVGTDVSTAALEVAREARYAGRTVDLAEPGAVARWLRPGPDGDHVVRDEVRALVEFAHHNLVTEAPPFPAGSVDLVVCRNVTIYFSRETTRSLVGRFRDVLAPVGWLLLGPAETLWQLSEAFALVPVGEAFAYRPAVARATGRTPSRPAARPQSPALRVERRARTRPDRAPRPDRAARRDASQPGAAVQPSPGRPPAADRAAVPSQAATATELLAAAREAFESARYADAAVLAARACVADPLLVDAYVVCGQAEATMGRDAEALGPLGRAVYLDARAGHAWFLLAGSLGRTGDRAGAARAYRAAAGALPSAPAEAVHGLLDGTPLEQLVQLCVRLADDLEGRDDLRRGA